MYRIDNGGSLTFRAQGKPKEFPSESIPELKNMLNPEFSAGQVFAGLTEEELKVQAEQLVANLSDEDIETIVKQSGLDEEQAKTIQTGLIGRKHFLVTRFNLKQKSVERIPIAIEKLKEQLEQLSTLELRPRVGILTDTDKIENQEIDIIDASDIGRYEINFKLTAHHWKTVLANLRKMRDSQNPDFIFSKSTGFSESTGENTIYYTKTAKPLSSTERQKDIVHRYHEDNTFRVASALTIKKGNILIKISTAGESDFGYYGHNRSAFGVVHIEIPNEDGLSSEEMEEKINNIFKDILQVETGLTTPPLEAEKTYKKARYAWLHKLDSSELVPEEVSSKLTREEVISGYFTFVEKDAHKKYQQISPYAVYHSLCSPSTLPKLIRAGGLLSTHERYRRGLLFSGLSSSKDLESGGGDSVFTRLVTSEGVKGRSTLSGVASNDGTIIFHPRILDRTDWYAYSSDNYGKTSTEEFSRRQSPRQVFSEQENSGYNHSNEQMFRCGISTNDILAIAVTDEEGLINLRHVLHIDGIDTLNDRPIEEMIVIAKTHDDAINISGGKSENLMTLAKFLRENPDRVLEIEIQPITDLIDNLHHTTRMWIDYATTIREYDSSNEEAYEYITPNRVSNRLEELLNLMNTNLIKYIQDHYRDPKLFKIPEKNKMELLEKIRLLLKSVGDFIEILRTRKADMVLGDSLDFFEHKIVEIETQSVSFINSIKEF